MQNNFLSIFLEQVLKFSIFFFQFPATMVPGNDGKVIGNLKNVYRRLAVIAGDKGNGQVIRLAIISKRLKCRRAVWPGSRAALFYEDH